MKHKSTILVCIALLTASVSWAQSIAPSFGRNVSDAAVNVGGGLCFYKGALLVSLSEGSTTANYSTSEVRPNSCLRHKCKLDGTRDPFFLEYGLTDRWGIGISQGNDLFTVNAQDYYGFNTKDNKPLSITTSEFSFNLNYHAFVSGRVDLSLFSSLGCFGVNYSSQIGETNFNYKAKGGIARIGTTGRYYFGQRKRFGALLMLSAYSGSAKPKNNAVQPQSGDETATSTSPLVKTYSTRITGTAIEFGICYRFF